MLFAQKKGEGKFMKKKLLVSIALIAMLAVTTFMVFRGRSTSAPSLIYNPAIYKDEFAEAADFETTGEPLDDPVPFWVDMVNAENYNGGEGIYIAVLDTGLMPGYWPFFFPDTMVDIKEEWGKGWSYDVVWNPGINDFDWTENPTRGYLTGPGGSGHGTHVTSTIVGYNFNNIMWVKGVAPKVTIIPVLVLDTWLLDCPDPSYPGCYDGKVLFRGGDDWMIASGIYYIADLAESEGIRIIINMSLGGPDPMPIIEEAINYAISKGVIVCASAGNRYEAQMGWPGAYPQVISSAAGGWTEGWITRPPQTRWWLNDVTEKYNTKDYWGNNWQIFLEDFSSRPNRDLGQDWKDLDVCTPGAAVVGPYDPEVYWTGTQWYDGGPGYYYLWGTSMSVPHTCGIAAAVLEQHPDFNQFDVQYALKAGAKLLPLPSNAGASPAFALDSTPWYFWWDDHDYGSGFLTLDNALFGAFVYSRGGLNSRGKAFIPT